jgi:DNA-binding MarR family transcriptional regulator
MTTGVSGGGPGGANPRNYDDYVRAIAEARYTIRRVQRIIDEQARSVGLDPLEHQALLQVHAADGSMLSVSALSDRLDVQVEVASRLAKQLEGSGLLERRRAREDRRVTELRLAPDGIELVHRILREVVSPVQLFAQDLTTDSKLRSLMVFAFYLGLDLPVDELREVVATGATGPLWPT